MLQPPNASRGPKLHVVNCATAWVWLTVPKPTERQRIGNQIDAAFVFAGSDFLGHRSGGMGRVITGTRGANESVRRAVEVILCSVRHLYLSANEWAGISGS
jgi:hypothetical protein